MDRRMTPEEIRDFVLAGTRTGKLAFVGGDGAALVTPIWFVLDDEGPVGPTGIADVMFTTGVDTAKGRALRRDPRVAFVVDDDRADAR